MNNVILTGNVCAIYINATNVRVTIADTYKDKTSFIPVSVFDKNAEFIKKYVTKGDHIGIEGRIGTYTTNTGAQALCIIANRVNFEGYKRPSKNTPPQNTTEQNTAEQFTDIPIIDDLPFDDVL